MREPPRPSTSTRPTTSSNEDGDCSLREAIVSANGNVQIDDCEKGEDADIIVIPAGTYVLSIPSANVGDNQEHGDLDIRDHVTLKGAGASTTTVDADGISRVFDVGGDITVLIEGLTVTGGDVDQEIDDESNDGGGIESDGTLTLRDSVVTANKAGFSGGGIDSDNEGSSLRLERSVVSNNTAGYEGGGIRQDNSYTSIAVIDSTVSGNTAGRGGGIHIDNGSEVTIDGSTISGNTATGDLEGIDRFRGGGFDCGTGGGYNQDGSGEDDFLVTTTITNTTVSGNTAQCGGGGLHVQGTTDLTNVTVTANSSPDAGNVAAQASEGTTKTLVNTIVAQPTLGTDCLGALVSGGGNIQSDDAGTATCDVGAVEVVYTPEETTTTTADDGVDDSRQTQTPAAQPTVARPTFTG